MKVLVVGSGGREHAICWKLSKSPKVDKIYCAPGNAGIAELAECVDIKAMEFEKLVAFAKENSIDLTVIGMDDPLVGGVVDIFEAEGLIQIAAYYMPQSRRLIHHHSAHRIIGRIVLS